MPAKSPDRRPDLAEPLPSGPASVDVGAVIVGAGLAGLCALHHLLARGMTVRVFEVGGGVGGTWFWNCYPGARCDVESVDYSYGFDDELQQEWTWTERYATQAEILRYIEHVAERFDLRRHITLNTRVVAAEYSDTEAAWTVRTDTGEVVRARICVMASGCLSAPRVPPIAGVQDFTGEVIHPGRWPQDGAVDLADRSVGILGTGSTGIQLVSALAPIVRRLTVFQRTPNYSMPAHNGPLAAEEMRAIKASYPERRRIARATRRGFPLPPHVTNESVFAFSAAERRERLERGWAYGGAIFTSTFGDLGSDLEANRVAADFVREQIVSTVHDPEVATHLCPDDHPLGGKRPCVDTGYYAAFNRPNVDLVDLRVTPIVAFTADGLKTTVAHVPLDAIIFATGYDAITGSLNAIDIAGRDGRLLRNEWDQGPSAYLGLCCAGFPNLFLLTGPGSPSVLCNMTVSIEQHVELMMKVLERAEQEGIVAVEVEADAEAAWAEHVAEVAEGTLLVQADSWYRGSNIPGKPKTFMPYAGGMAAFDSACRKIIADGCRGFRFGADVLGSDVARGVRG